MSFALIKCRTLFTRVKYLTSYISVIRYITSIIVDGNRTNQNFFKRFGTVANKPWLTFDGIFLLYDFVHLLKSIRNDWLTEKTGEIAFKEDDKSFVAKWSDLIQLYEIENTTNLSGVCGVSKLTEAAVCPKPLERQRVSTCLKVFCEELLIKCIKSASKVEG